MSFLNGNEIFINMQPKLSDSQLNGNPNFINNLNSSNKKELKSIGYYFDGIPVQEKHGSPVYGSINAVNKFNDLSFEELRLNDYTFAKTGLLPQQPTIFKRNEYESSHLNINGFFGENHNNNIFEMNPNIFNFSNNSFMNNSNSNQFFKSNDAQSNNLFNRENKNFGFFGNNNNGSLFENKNMENGGTFFGNRNNFGRLFENSNNNSQFFGNINNDNKFSFFNNNNQISNNRGMLGNAFNNNFNVGPLGYNNNNCGLFQNNNTNGGLYENNNLNNSSFSFFNNHDNDNHHKNLLGAEKNIISNNSFVNQNNNNFIGNGLFSNTNNNMTTSLFDSQKNTNNNISLFGNQGNNSIQFSFGIKSSNNINNNNNLFNNINNGNNLFFNNNGKTNSMFGNINNNNLFCNINNNNNNNNNNNSLFGNLNNNKNEIQRTNLFGEQSINNNGNGLFINQFLFNNQNSFSNENQNGGVNNESFNIFSFSQNESISTQPTSFLGRKSSLLGTKEDLSINNNNNLDINNNSYLLNNNRSYNYNNNNNNYENKDSSFILNLNENKIHTEKKRKSLGQILLNKMKEQEELDLLSYNSNYKQEKIDEENKKELNKYKYEISSTNNININPELKNSLLSIKEYFSKTGKRFRPYRSKSGSFDISMNLESKFLTNLENSFSRKISISSQKKKEKKTIKINCHIKEPHKVNFSLLLGKKVEVSVLKQTICDQLSKKNKVYASLKSNSFCLMKNYMFVQELGTIGETILSDGDDVYIILKESMNKCRVEEK